MNNQMTSPEKTKDYADGYQDGFNAGHEFGLRQGLADAANAIMRLRKEPEIIEGLFDAPR